MSAERSGEGCRLVVAASTWTRISCTASNRCAERRIGDINQDDTRTHYMNRNLHRF